MEHTLVFSINIFTIKRVTANSNFDGPYLHSRSLENSVADLDPDPYVFEPPRSESGSISHWYGSGSFYHQAKIVRKTLIPTVL
jgi:hypothetical protein